MVKKEEDMISGYAIEDVVKMLMNKHRNEFGFNEFDESKGITVEALCYYCMDEIDKGNAQKHIQISRDDEGNGFHTLFYGFSLEDLDTYDYHDNVEYKNIILLG